MSDPAVSGPKRLMVVVPAGRPTTLQPAARGRLTLLHGPDILAIRVVARNRRSHR